MPKHFNISLIGSGNLASNLAKALEHSSHQINEIYSQNLSNAQALAKQLRSCMATDKLDFSESKSDIIIIAVKDEAIQEVIDKIKIKENTILVHSSGTTSLDVFSISESKAIADIQTGIFYPLQTFNKDKLIDFAQVPILYESKSEKTNQILKTLGESVSTVVKRISSEERKSIHLAAVFASNFTNRMLSASKIILDGKNIPLEILKPLVIQSLENCFDSTPDQALTGPAKRKDVDTVNKHLAMLEYQPELKQVYELITNSILEN